MSNALPRLALAVLAVCALPLSACRGEAEAPAPPPAAEPTKEATGAPVGTRNAYFGDLHIHTGFSYDAFMFGGRANPDDAYRYAKGETIMHAGGYPIRLRGAPLDFLSVTDHAFYMGVLYAMNDPNHELSSSPVASQFVEGDADTIAAARAELTSGLMRGERDDRVYHPDVMRDTWQEEIAAAQRHYQPGQFTTFIGYEYTSHPGYNLHRNVIFRGTNVPDVPFGVLESQNPEDLWRWLDEQREQGNEALAIPHNSNWSAGHMFERNWTNGDALNTEYAELRMRNEPLVEVTQVKGTSETHPMLSPNDEWADFEIWNEVTLDDAEGIPGRVEATDLEHIRGGYARGAYLAGLEYEENEGFNPYKFGMIGSSDGHNAGAGYEESNYYGKVGLVDATPELRGSVPPGGTTTWPANGSDVNKGGAALWAWGASGLAAVWADTNTREDIYDAFRRKETFATSGPRIRVRFFAGFDYPEDLLDDRDAIATAYAGGVPMGGDLVATSDKAPQFFTWAVRDPRSTWLDRLQIVKGWIQDGEAREQVFDVACSDGRKPDPYSHRCSNSGASVNTSDCSASFDEGAAELSAVWSDPTFDAGQRAFYYVRVLENTTCRWSTWDAIRAQAPPNPRLKTTVQDRAWSSPIWYLPHAVTAPR